jgi:AAA+ ATPase superfamily predicted ATPase
VIVYDWPRKSNRRAEVAPRSLRLRSTEFGVVYGRRRLGNRRLVKKALEGYDEVVFYQVRQKTGTVQLKQFVETAAETFPGIEDIRPDWQRLFTYLAERDAIVAS